MGKLFLHGRSSEKENTEPSAKLTVNCPSGSIVRIESDQTSIYLERTSDGKAVFTNLSEGIWNIKFVNAEHALSKSVEIDGLEKEISMEYFTATMSISYPVGSTCTATDGVTTLSAPDTSGEWTCVVSNSGDWTVTSTDGEQSVSETVSISSDEDSGLNAASVMLYESDDLSTSSGVSYGRVVNISLKYFSATIDVAVSDLCYKVVCWKVNNDGSNSVIGEYFDVSDKCSFSIKQVGRYKVDAYRVEPYSSIESIPRDYATGSDIIIDSDGLYEEVTLKFFKSTVNVTYPSGALCSVTDSNGYTEDAPGTNGIWMCSIPRIGTWTFSLDNGFSETIIITTDGEEHTLNKWYLCNDGDTRAFITGGWSGVLTTVPTVSTVGNIIENESNITIMNNNGEIYGVATSSGINLTGFNTLHVLHCGCIRILAAESYPTSNIAAAYTSTNTYSTPTELLLDISNLNGSYRVAIDNILSEEAVIYQVWLT